MAPIKTGWVETDKGQPKKPIVRARWVAKEYKTHARPELYASTPPLEVLKVVLSEIATGQRGGKVVSQVDVRSAYFYPPARRRVFVDLPITMQVTNTCAGCCNTACTARATPHKFGRRRLVSTLSDLNEGARGPCLWKGCIKGEQIVATLHGEDITIGGEPSVVEFVIENVMNGVRDKEASDWSRRRLCEERKNIEQCD